MAAQPLALTHLDEQTAHAVTNFIPALAHQRGPYVIVGPTLRHIHDGPITVLRALGIDVQGSDAGHRVYIHGIPVLLFAHRTADMQLLGLSLGACWLYGDTPANIRNTALARLTGTRSVLVETPLLTWTQA